MKKRVGPRKVHVLVRWICWSPAMLILGLTLVCWVPFLFLRHLTDAVEELLFEVRAWAKRTGMHPKYYDFFERVEEANMRDRDRALRELRK